ncbi:hypothetical protein D5086_021579 [Populus alba]|uniref:Uncharacterized protein n=1 Tax=Populus alba TaxID=43335 RepID=A0ACC4BD51_POPAL
MGGSFVQMRKPRRFLESIGGCGDGLWLFGSRFFRLGCVGFGSNGGFAKRGTWWKGEMAVKRESLMSSTAQQSFRALIMRDMNLVIGDTGNFGTEGLSSKVVLIRWSRRILWVMNWQAAAMPDHPRSKNLWHRAASRMKIRRWLDINLQITFILSTRVSCRVGRLLLPWWPTPIDCHKETPLCSKVLFMNLLCCSQCQDTLGWIMPI